MSLLSGTFNTVFTFCLIFRLDGMGKMAVVEKACFYRRQVKKFKSFDPTWVFLYHFAESTCQAFDSVINIARSCSISRRVEVFCAFWK